MEEDHYAVLGIPEDVDARTLRAAYLARMRLHHPDRQPGDSGDRARAINRAYEVLRDPVRRDAYDRIRRARRGEPTRVAPPSLARFDGGAWVAGNPRPTRRGHRVGPPGARPVDNAAYSEDYRHYYRHVTAALLRIGGAVFTIGVVLILLLST